MLLAQNHTVLQSQRVSQRIVHSALSQIQIGVGADSGQIRPHQRAQLLAQNILVRHRPGRMKDHRMMGHDQLSPCFLRFLDHRQGNVQGHQNFGNRLVPAAHQKARVIKTHLRGKWSHLVQKIVNL